MKSLFFPLYSSADSADTAQFWQTELAQLGVETELKLVETIDAKFLRLHPQSSLIVDVAGVWLAEDGMKMQPAWSDELPRLKRASIKNELIARACHLPQAQHILDATAGLGHDGLLLAWLGAKVTLVERHPVLYLLLKSSLQTAQQHPSLQHVTERIELLHIDASDYLQQIEPAHYDVIYLDPMFPVRDANQKKIKKQAAVKKQMQLLHRLLDDNGNIDLGDQLLLLAQQKASRVIVKRPRKANFLANLPAHHQWQGDACRFDAYLKA